jgi:hypothetical protein
MCEKHDRWLPFAARSRHPVRKSGLVGWVQVFATARPENRHVVPSLAAGAVGGR